MTRQHLSVLVVILILSALVCFSLTPARAAPTAPTFTVNSPADVVASAPLDNGVCETAPGNGVCTLRAAIMKANHYPGGGATINFGLPGVVTYTLTIPASGTDDERTGDLNTTNTMTINGNSTANTIIDGNHTDRVFRIDGGNTVTIFGVTIRNGKTNGAGGGIFNGTGSTLTLSDSIVSANVAVDGGGGIVNHGTLALFNSTVSGNTAPDGSGGGIATGIGPLKLVNSTISGNNSAGYGGGISNSLGGTLTLINSTISGNKSSINGGGIYNDSGTTSLFNATITDNLANADAIGGGVGGGVEIASGTVNFRNSILAGNFRAVSMIFAFSDDCGGTLTSQGNNILSTDLGCTVSGGGVTFTDPMLGSLANNGGSTQTHALLTGSPAIDAGNVGGCTDNFGAILATDQRGFHRPEFGKTGLRCDIGAFELQQLLYLPLIVR